MSTLAFGIHGEDEDSRAGGRGIGCDDPPIGVIDAVQRLGVWDGNAVLSDGSCGEQTSEREEDVEKPRDTMHRNGVAAEHKQIPEQCCTAVCAGQTKVEWVFLPERSHSFAADFS